MSGELAPAVQPTSGTPYAYVAPNGQVSYYTTALNTTTAPKSRLKDDPYADSQYQYYSTPSGNMWLSPYNSVQQAQQQANPLMQIQSKYTTAPKQGVVDPLSLYRSRKAGLL